MAVGRLGDIFGRVRIYNAGFAVFTVASVLLSFDPFDGGHGAMWLIGWRILQALGGSMPWIMTRHILPNITRIISAQFAITVAFGIFSSASLSFLGLGVPPPTPDWGSMVREGVQFLTFCPLMSITPGAAVTITVLGFYLLGSKDD